MLYRPIRVFISVLSIPAAATRTRTSVGQSAGSWYVNCLSEFFWASVAGEKKMTPLIVREISGIPFVAPSIGNRVVVARSN